MANNQLRVLQLHHCYHTWKSRGRPLVWDVTCPDTLATLYELHATSKAGAVAALAEWEKMAKHETHSMNSSIPPHCHRDLRCLWPRCLQHCVIWPAELKMFPVSKTQRRTCLKNFLLRCREAIQQLSWGVLV